MSDDSMIAGGESRTRTFSKRLGKHDQAKSLAVIDTEPAEQKVQPTVDTGSPLFRLNRS